MDFAGHISSYFCFYGLNHRSFLWNFPYNSGKFPKLDIDVKRLENMFINCGKLAYTLLVGGIPTHLNNMTVSWEYAV